MLSLNMLRMIPRDYTTLWGIFEGPSPDVVEAFLRGRIFNKTPFCFEEKQGMLLNDECSSWYNRVGGFF